MSQKIPDWVGVVAVVAIAVGVVAFFYFRDVRTARIRAEGLCSAYRAVAIRTEGPSFKAEGYRCVVIDTIAVHPAIGVTP